ncbi:MAG: hypothetical protein JNJ54_28100 [Myxococcaceae bacterium]|nr:hypothetical protein [Myxococcaceae bacterium]
MASVFVLPTYRACSDEPLHSPAHFVSDPVAAAWIAPSFLVAGFLAFLTARALRKKEVDLTTRRLGLLVVAGLAASTLLGSFVTTSLTNSPWPFAFVGAAVAGAVLVLRRARGRPGFKVWEHLLAAFAVVVATAGPALVLGGELLFGNRALVGPGGWLYVGALAALLPITLGAVAASRR